MPLGTIGIATHNDSKGIWATLQSLRMYHRNALAGWEIVVVDNDPHGRAARRTHSLVRSCGKQARYIPLESPVGVYPARNRVFEEAAGEFVYLLDSHVMLEHGSLPRLAGWFAEHPGSMDIISGPMLMDSMSSWVTHLAPVWRGDSFGTWATAWRAPSGEPFGVLKVGDGTPRMVKINDRDNTPADFQVPITNEGATVAILRDAGCVRLGPRYLGAEDYDDLPIFGMGMGAFACRKAAWPGFHPAMVGHGGGELTMHEKFRQQGGQALSQSWLGWHHCTDQNDRPTYPLTTRNRVRNWAISFGEVGWNVQDVGDHYVGAGKMNEADWQAIKADPINAPSDQPKPRPAPAPKDGPGTQFKLLAEAAGAKMTANCSCRALMEEMNRRGVDGCRDPEFREKAIVAMKKNMGQWGWTEWLKVGVKAAWNGQPLTVEGMYDEAVRREAARTAIAS